MTLVTPAQESLTMLKPPQLFSKQVRFCEKYIQDLNCAGAYIRAGYLAKNVEVARVAACRLLTNVNVQHYIQELKQSRSQRSRSTDNLSTTHPKRN